MDPGEPPDPWRESAPEVGDGFQAGHRALETEAMYFASQAARIEIDNGSAGNVGCVDVAVHPGLNPVSVLIECPNSSL